MVMDQIESVAEGVSSNRPVRVPPPAWLAQRVPMWLV